MNELLMLIKSAIYDPHGLSLSKHIEEKESQVYGACRFEINGLKIISRNAKITPTKVGQFVTIWKRSPEGITQPLDESDEFDLLVINMQYQEQFGQFVFSKSFLCEKHIITTHKKIGKRGIRVYPPWDKPTSKQAIKTQNWQLQYFLSTQISKSLIKKMYD